MTLLFRLGAWPRVAVLFTIFLILHAGTCQHTAHRLHVRSSEEEEVDENNDLGHSNLRQRTTTPRGARVEEASIAIPTNPARLANSADNTEETELKEDKQCNWKRMYDRAKLIVHPYLERPSRLAKRIYISAEAVVDPYMRKSYHFLSHYPLETALALSVGLACASIYMLPPLSPPTRPSTSADIPTTSSTASVPKDVVTSVLCPAFIGYTNQLSGNYTHMTGMLSEAASRFSTQHSLVDEKLLKALSNNDLRKETLDLSGEILTETQLRALHQVVQNNREIGYIQWGELSAEEAVQHLCTKIDQKLVENILRYSYHPSTYVHALLAEHVYTSPKVGGSIPNDPCWDVEQATYDDKTGFGSALYVNPTTHQVVLAFQGTDPMSLADIEEDIAGILASGITNQQSLVFQATQQAVKYVQDTGFHLSITGHSLGAFLAELAVYFCYHHLSHTDVQGVVFDSPGSLDWLRERKPNIPNGEAFEVFMNRLPVSTYLSAPNLINSCNGHIGTVYRLYPKLKFDEWYEKAVSFVLPATSKGILQATKGHLFDVILPCFNQTTGEPSHYTRVNDWPKLSKEKLEKEHNSNHRRPSGTIGGALSSVMATLRDRHEIDQHQYWTTIQQCLNDQFAQPAERSSGQAFTCLHEGHYQESALGTHEAMLTRAEQEGTIDHYLSDLGAYDLESLTHIRDRVVRDVLQNIRKQYELNREDKRAEGRATISLYDRGGQVATVRTQMRRAREVLGTERIEKALREIDSQTTCQTNLNYLPISPIQLREFVSRDAEMRQLAEALAKESICVLSGHGGAGKSTLAASYGYEQRTNATRAVRWMRAEGKDKLLDSYQQLAKDLCIAYEDLAQNPKLAANPREHLQELSRRVYNALGKRKQPTLLILDNADDAILIDAVLRNKPARVQVIITTRDAKDFREYTRIPLKAFDLKEGKEYVNNRLEKIEERKDSEEDIERLLKEVGLIPQKLSLATGYLRKNWIISIDEYLKIFHECKRGLTATCSTGVMPEVVLGVETLQPEAQLLLRYSSYLDPDFIPLELFKELMDVSNVEMQEHTDALKHLSLVTVVSSKQRGKLGIRIHREVQAACRAYGWEGEPEAAVLGKLLNTLNEQMPEVSEMPDQTWQQAELYAPQVIAALPKIEKVLGPVRKELESLLTKLGAYMGNREQPNYQLALKYKNKSLEITRNIHAEDNTRVAKALVNTGWAYEKVGDIDGALTNFREALKIYHRLHPDQKHPDVAWACSQVGLAYSKLGDKNNALEYLNMSLDIYKALPDDKSAPSVAWVLSNVGFAYQKLGHLDEGFEAFKRALAIYEKLHSADKHPSLDLAWAFNNMGQAYLKRNNKNKGLEYLNKSLKMYKAFYANKDHYHVAWSLSNLGVAYLELEDWGTSLDNFEQALEMSQRIAPHRNHPQIAWNLHNVGKAYMKLGNSTKGLKHLHEGLKMYESLYPDGHENVAWALKNIGQAYEQLGDLQKSLQYFDEALKMYEALKHAEVSIVAKDLDRVRKKLAQQNTALKE